MAELTYGEVCESNYFDITPLTWIQLREPIEQKDFDIITKVVDNQDYLSLHVFSDVDEYKIELFSSGGGFITMMSVGDNNYEQNTKRKIVGYDFRLCGVGFRKLLKYFRDKWWLKLGRIKKVYISGTQRNIDMFRKIVIERGE